MVAEKCKSINQELIKQIPSLTSIPRNHQTEQTKQKENCRNTAQIIKGIDIA